MQDSRSSCSLYFSCSLFVPCSFLFLFRPFLFLFLSSSLAPSCPPPDPSTPSGLEGGRKARQRINPHPNPVPLSGEGIKTGVMRGTEVVPSRSGVSRVHVRSFGQRP